MTNVPLEIQRRAATRLHNATTMQALDIAPSPFLQEKLSESSSELLLRRGPKSTPKRKVKLLRMDSSVVVACNMSLPTLPEASISILSAPPTDSNDEPPSSPASFVKKNPSLLSVSASAPVLIGSGGSHLSSMKTSYSDIATAVAVVDNEELKRTSIERKLKLYEDIVATFDSEAATSSKSPERGAAKRRSQPYVPAWKTSASPTSSSSASRGNGDDSSTSQSPMKRHSVLSMKTNTNDSDSSVNGTSTTGPPVFAHNPFGPFYTVRQVIEFGNIITRFDEDFSGDIDQQEWVSMLQSFRSLDRDDSGRISLQEILPAMFSKATPEQLQKMKLFLRTHTEASAKEQKQPPLKEQAPQQQQ